SAVRSTYRTVIQAGVPVHRRSVPYRLRPEEQEAVGYWSASHYPLRGPHGRVTHVLSITVDVTDEALGQAHLQETQQRALSTLARIARQLTTAGQAPSFFDDLSATIAELVSAERVAFWLYDPDEETLSTQLWQVGFTVDELQLASRLPCRRGGTDPLERVVFDDLIVVRGSDVAVPWKAGDHRLGALGAYHSTRPSGFTDEDVRALQAAGTAAAPVWEPRPADHAPSRMSQRPTTH